MSDTKIDIPERHQAFCKAVAELAREHKLDKFHGTFTPGFNDPDDWQDRIEFSWEQGRHGDAADRIFMSSTKRVWTRLGPEKPRY